MTHDHGHGTQDELVAHWEDRYSGDAPIWSGRVNATVADVVSSLDPGIALDLGCGEGGDAIWLAQQGWQVTGVDISATAIARATAAAADSDLTSDQVTFVAVDLSEWRDDREYDLVTSAFLHSEVDFPRTAILRRASARVRSGGHFLLVTHAAMPPWSDAVEHAHEHHPRLLSPADEIAELALEPGLWTAEIAELRSRDAVGPDGQHAKLDDGVVLLRRA